MLAPLAAGAAAGPARSSYAGRRARAAGRCSAGRLVALVALAVAVPHTSDDPLAQSAWSDPALGALPPGTKVLDDWASGGYLMWRYPQLDLMMHGYGDTFTTAELTRNNDLLLVGPGWEHDLRERGARVAVLRPWSVLASQLAAQEGWRVVHSSDDLEMLRGPRDVALGRRRRCSPGSGSAG